MKFLINVLLFFISISFLNSAFAFQLSPIVAELTPEGNGSRYSFTLENKTKDKVAAKAQVLLREYDSKGTEIRTPTNDFLVYPAQLSLEAGEKRNIRITFLGDKHPPKELAYRLMVQQLPIDFNKEKPPVKGGTVNIFINFVASVFVRPPGAIAKARIDRIERLDERHVNIYLKNYGTAHQALGEMKIDLFLEDTQHNKKAPRFRYDSKNVKDLEIGSLMPGQEKVIKLTLAKEVPRGVLKGEIILP